MVSIQIRFSDFIDGLTFLKALRELKDVSLVDFWISEEEDLYFEVEKGYQKDEV